MKCGQRETCSCSHVENIRNDDPHFSTRRVACKYYTVYSMAILSVCLSDTLVSWVKTAE